MLRIPQLEEIQSKLLEVPKLIDAYQAKDSLFLDNVLTWFTTVEAILQRNRLTAVSEIASMRGAIISAQRGSSLTMTLPRPRRRDTRRNAEMTAEQMIRTAVDVITKQIDGDLALLKKAESAMNNLVSVGRQLKIIPTDTLIKSSQTTLHSLWDGLAGHEMTLAYTTLIRGIVGHGDALILLDKVLSKWSEQ